MRKLITAIFILASFPASAQMTYYQQQQIQIERQMQMQQQEAIQQQQLQYQQQQAQETQYREQQLLRSAPQPYQQAPIYGSYR